MFPEHINSVLGMTCNFVYLSVYKAVSFLDKVTLTIRNQGSKQIVQLLKRRYITRNASFGDVSYDVSRSWI